MRHNRRRLTLTAMAASMACIGAGAEENTLKDVVVSATKIEQSTAEAPSNVSIITSDELENGNVSRLGDALTAQVPSLYIRGAGLGTTARENGTSIMTLRGAYGSRTKIVVDGVATLADGNAGSPNLSSVPLSDIDRVEVVPGVSSALYGSDAIGGVINIISKTPTKRELNAQYTQGFGDGERKKYEFSYRDRFESGLGISANYARQDSYGTADSDVLTVAPTTRCGTCSTTTSGWKKVQAEDGTTQYIIGDRGEPHSRTENFNTTLFYDFSASEKIKLGYNHYKTELEYSRYHLYLNANGSPLSLPASNLNVDGLRVASLGENSLSLPSSVYKEENRVFAGYETLIGNDYRLKLDVSRADRDGYYFTKGTTTATSYDGGPGTSTHTPNVTYDAQAQLSFPLSDEHFIVSGVAYNGVELNRRVYSVSNWRDDDRRLATTDAADGHTRTYSAYVQDQYTLSDATTLYLGARYDNWSHYGTKRDFGVDTDVSRVTHDAVSPRLAIVHRLSDSVSLKASAGTAFRAPTLYDLYAADNLSGTTRLLRSNANLKPEKAKSIDFGTEVGIGQGGVVRAAYFYTVITDMIYTKETAYTGPYDSIIPTTVKTLSTKTNAAEGVTKGIELSAEYPLTNWLKVNSSYTYTDARITKDDTGTGMQGKYLVYVPKNMFSIGLAGEYGSWSYDWQTRYTGRSYSTALNTDTETDVYGGVSKYWLSDMKLSYRIDKHFKVSVMVNNVFDKTYYESYLMPGRNAAIQLSAAL